MRLKTTFFTLIAFVFGIISIKSFMKQDPAKNQVEIEKNTSFQDVNQPKLPNKLEYAGEVVPLKYYDVRERLDKEILVNTYWHSNTLQLIKRANRFFPIIEKILKEEGIPDDFKYLAVAESGLEDVVSPSGAAGFWQFLRGAAKDFNLEVTKQVDERYHLEKSTRAACKYLKWNKEKFGTWVLSAAAYNYGRTNTLKQMKRQNCSNYYDLLLPEETERYIFRLIALKLIISSPEKYGFHINPGDLYPVIPTHTVTIRSSIDDMAEFAAKYNLSYRMLKEFNPWLRENYLKVTGNKSYKIQMPKKRYRYIYNHLTY